MSLRSSTETPPRFLEEGWESGIGLIIPKTLVIGALSVPPNKLFHSSEQEAGEVASFFFFFFSIRGLNEGFAAVDILVGVLDSKRVLVREREEEIWRGIGRIGEIGRLE